VLPERADATPTPLSNSISHVSRLDALSGGDEIPKRTRDFQMA
jgi:hypothetical protein